MKTQTIKERKIKSLSLLISLLIFPLMFSLIPKFMMVSDAPHIDGVLEEDNNILDRDEDIPVSSALGDPWWDSDWKYRKPIVLQSNTQNLVDYQIELSINLTDDYNAGRIKDYGADLRFVNSTNEEISHWTESFKTDGTNSTIWVKVPSIPSATTETIYMYYGNTAATNTSDGSSTFILYDDFINLDQWELPSSRAATVWQATTASGRTVLDFEGSSNWYYGRTKNVYDLENTTTDMMLKTKALRELDFSYCLESGSYSGHYGYSNINHFRDHINADWKNAPWVWVDGGNVIGAMEGSLIDSWLVFTTTVTTTDVTGTYNGYSLTNTNDPTTFSSRLCLGMDDDNLNGMYVDWFRLREHTPIEPTMVIGELEYSQLEITCLDIDGRVVPNATIYITNITNPTLDKSGMTDDDGEYLFYNVPIGTYNITVNYTLDSIPNGETRTVAYLENYIHDTHELDIILDIWTIDFEVDDFDRDPMDVGYVLVYNDSSADPLLANLTLGSGTGISTFRWINNSDYYYEVYHENHDYINTKRMIINGSKARINPFNSTTYNVNDTAVDFGGTYLSTIIIYANGSNAAATGNNRMVTTNITLSDITDYLVEFKFSYFDDDLSWNYMSAETRSYEITDTSDNISIYIMDDIDAYGIKLEVEFDNTTQSDGTIEVNFTQTTHVQTIANMSKLEITTYDQDGVEAVVNLEVRIENATGGSIVNLTTNDEGQARDTIGLSFWYFHGDFNITCFFYEAQKPFNITTTDELVYPTDVINVYNYTLDNASALVFNVTVNVEDFLSNFTTLAEVSSATWGAPMFFAVNYTISDDKGDSWTAIQNPEYVRYEVNELGQSTVLASGDMNPSGLNDGNYSITLDSEDFIGGKNYEITISGYKIGYTDPDDKLYYPTINTKTTALGFYNYTSPGKVTAKYNELINLTLSYNDTIDDVLLQAETFNYSWIHGSGNILIDPLRPNYHYYLELNTSQNIGSYEIDITATLANHTSIDDNFILEIQSRPTQVNNSIDTSYTYTLDVFEGRNFTLEYNDTLISSRVGGCEVKYYNWWKLDASGARSTIAGEFGYNVENVTETVDYLYVVDFDTESKALGTYEVIVHLQKNNYEEQTIFFSITIEKREFTSYDNQDIVSAAQIKTIMVDHSVSVDLVFTLTDSSAGRVGAPLEDATVTVIIDGTSYKLTETSPGEYSRSISTTDYDTFFGAMTLACRLTIAKENYESQDYTFNINVGMIEGPIPGIPTFYFLLIVGAIIAVVGSLTISRAIRNARIPKFVKKATRIIGAIKGRKSISESDLYPSKDEFFVKKLGDRWDLLGISLRDIMGLEIKKGKTLPEPEDKVEKPEGGAIE